MSDISAVLLVGGKGTRLRSAIPGKPKPLASVGQRPFLELIVRQLSNQGIRRLVMCTGYLADQIERVFGDGRSLGVKIEYSRESCPLGTGGAVKLSKKHLPNSPVFLVMNGDSFLEIDLARLIRFHRDKNGVASIAVRQVPNAQRYGTVQVAADHRVIGFAEKLGNAAPGIVNAGIYVFDQTLFEHIPEGTSSLETDVFPNLLNHGVYALEEYGMFIDIGTPEDYVRAQEMQDPLNKAALR